MGKKQKKHKSSWPHGTDSSMEKAPIKLVFKLGNEVVYDSDYAANSPTPMHDKHKQRKRKRPHDNDFKDLAASHEATPSPSQDESEMDVSSPEVKPPSPPEIVKDDVESVAVNQPKKPVASTENVRPAMTTVKRKALNSLLEHLLKQLERKDPHEIFAWPVNDLIAPGYSSVIDNPMDFGTMKKKVKSSHYYDVNDFKKDFELMINNCCTYNKPDTIYYDIAKKLLAAGTKIMSKERLKNMRRSLTFLHDLSKQDLSDIFNFPLNEEESVDITCDSKPETEGELNNKSSVEESEPEKSQDATEEELDLRPHADAISFTDADNEDTVAPDVIQAMKNARNRLETKCPKSRIGFLRMDDEGKTTLNILNPEANEESQRDVDLGLLTGHIMSGIDVMPEAKEDKRNKVTPLEYLSYGPFGSYAPSYDSRMSNLTQDESDLLLNAYGGDTEYLFAKSLEDFVSGSDRHIKHMVSDILDNLTHGSHSQAYKDVEKLRAKAGNKTMNPQKRCSQTVKVNYNDLRSLKDVGIDVSFVDEIEAKQASNSESQKALDQSEVRRGLESNSVLIKQLEKEQYNRLSCKPPNSEPNLQPPSQKEQEIAAELQRNLTDLTAASTPAQVCDPAGVRRAMGIATTT